MNQRQIVEKQIQLEQDLNTKLEEINQSNQLLYALDTQALPWQQRRNPITLFMSFVLKRLVRNSIFVQDRKIAKIRKALDKLSLYDYKIFN